MPDGLLGLATALVGHPVRQPSRAGDGRRRAGGARALPVARRRAGGGQRRGPDAAGTRARRVLLAGHLDTVPPVDGNDVPRLEGSTLFGVGAADMKGGLAVFLHLAGRLPEPAVDVTWCFYAAEEVAHEFNGLAPAVGRAPRPRGRRRRHPGRAHRGPGRGRVPGDTPGPGATGRVAGPHRPSLHGSERRPPAGTTADGGGRVRGPPSGPGRVRVRRAAPGGVRRGRGGRERRARRGDRRAQPPVRARP